MKIIVLIVAVLGLAGSASAQQPNSVMVAGFDPMIYHATVLNAVDQANCAPLPASESCLIVGMGGYSRVAIQLTGGGIYTVNFEQTLDGATWVPVSLTPSMAATGVTQASVGGIYTGIVGGSMFRVRVAQLPAGQAVTVSARVTMQ